ncbi:zinc-ribbon domain-containing protein [Methanococcoides orientis]|uniref:zinc ribbon domain-containing protein n=1 Tax=Methanococcoides orientis TaxID=2822137 RepID=UPI001E6378C9|nr:zinc-ribbon domain-containing protein [Methanococcoides orientis]UGV41394.1 zinc-ribbon domain-containing protein [Methanococcoides orientis]
MKSCSNCGAEIDEKAVICPKCGVPTGTQYPASQSPKDPGLAAVLSLLLSGLGQVYNGELKKGIGILVGVVVGWVTFLIPGIIICVYGVYDAYTTSKKMNSAEIAFKKANFSDYILFILVFLILIGLFAAILLWMELL